MSLFNFEERGSNVRQEVIAGLTTFLAMVYSIFVVPGMLSQAGFPAESVFIATCLVSGLGSILIGLWANAPMAIGSAIYRIQFSAWSRHLNSCGTWCNLPNGDCIYSYFSNGRAFLDLTQLAF